MELSKLIADEVHKGAQDTKDFRQVVSKYKNHIWAMDLVDMSRSDFPKLNNGIKFLLTCMDIYTRYAWVIPMKDKSGPETANAIMSIINKTKQNPDYIYCDQGKEFYNSNVEALRQKYNIGIYSTLGKNKASIIERFNRTFKSLMYKKFTENQNHRYLNLLDSLINTYNNKIHKSLNGLTPNSVYTNNIILDNKINYENLSKPKFKLGDLVRTTYKKNVFDKGYLANWTYELFKIAKVIKSNPITYKLKDLQGELLKELFYENELKKSKQNPDEALVEKEIKKDKNGTLVKWLGYPDKFNSYINNDDVLIKYKK
jgi:hypothetical protein